MEHSSYKFGARFSWDDVRIFVCVAQLGSLRASANILNISVNSVRRRIEHLEYEIDTPLLIRSSTGVELTEDGRKVFTVGLEMLEYAQTLGRLPVGRNRGMSGSIKLGVTEGIGTFWIAPRLIEFFSACPLIQIDLRCEMRLQDISRLEVDLAIQLDPPRDQNLILTRLGYLHLALFATEEYLAKFGIPSTMADIAQGRFVQQVSDQIPSEKLASYVAPIIPDEFINLKCNTSSAHAFAVARGAGIGVLPTYAIAVSKRLVSVMPHMTIKRDIWLVCHPEAAKVRRVKRLIKWLKKSFDAKMYPWFRQEYIPPEKLFSKISDSDIDILFNGFEDRPIVNSRT